MLDRYEFRDAAIKVVGVGSVGTACWVFLFMAGEGDPLFLQVKEARASVLGPYAGATVFPNHGQRVVKEPPPPEKKRGLKGKVIEKKTGEMK